MKNAYFSWVAGAALIPVSGFAQSLSRPLSLHELQVRLSPQTHGIEVIDSIELASAREGQPIEFELHSGLKPESRTPGVSLALLEKRTGDVPVERYRVTAPSGITRIAIAYQGEIFHPLENADSDTPGLISEEGVSLSSSTYWFPRIEGEELLTFSLEVEAPHGWRVVSQGQRTLQSSAGGFSTSKWQSPEPQDDIYLNAAHFTEYASRSGDTELYAFLREPDPVLAHRYLDATDRYLRMYNGLLGEYAYPKFALVENFWNTGYGMPSFTLIGSSILRLPFLLFSSYPHEVLHDWWGNGVYVRHLTGNWCEGLTTYFADHLLQEQQGNGREYRRETLQSYTDFVNEQNDFPLSKFRNRTDKATQAVGYGKAMMLFHMLRQRWGDALFTEAFRRFYRENLFRVSGYEDIRRAFDVTTGHDHSEEFRQWVERTGAPKLELRDVTVSESAGKYLLQGALRQVQEGAAYSLRVPVAIHLEGREQALRAVLSSGERDGAVRLELDARPTWIEIDPEYDVFRRLGADEIPPALSRAFGATRGLIVLPSGADERYVEVARAIRENSSEGAVIETVSEDQVSSLPSDRAVWVLGWENRHRDAALAPLREQGVEGSAARVRIGSVQFEKGRHSLALASSAAVWIGIGDPASGATFGAKLPHYGRFGQAVFEGPKLANVLKGQWSVLKSALSVPLVPGLPPKAKLAPRAPLAPSPWN